MLDCTSDTVYAWLLGDKKPCSRRVAREKFFIMLASIGIARLNDEILPLAEQILILSKQI